MGIIDITEKIKEYSEPELLIMLKKILTNIGKYHRMVLLINTEYNCIW